jgi:hypothetical protein
MSTKDQAEKVSLLNQQEKHQMKTNSQRNSENQDDLLNEADKNSLLRIKEGRTRVIEDMAQQNEKRNIRVRSFDGYEAAYFYQVVNASNGTTTEARENSEMNLLIMNKTRNRSSYRSTDPYSVTAIVSLVKPKEAKPGFSLREAKVIRRVAAVSLSAEGKKVIKLPMGFYMVQFSHKGKIVGSEPITLSSQYDVNVSHEDARGLSIPIEKIDGYVSVTLN